MSEYYKQITIELSEYVNKKIKVYLDTKYWIEICDFKLGKNKNKEVEKIYFYLKDGVKNNQLICPISYRIFKEILKQEDEQSLKQTISLVDELSQGIILREEKERVSLELFNFFYDSLGIEIDEQASKNYWDYIVNIMGLMIPYFPSLSLNNNLLIQKEWFDKIQNIRLSDMINTKWKDDLFRFREMKIDTNVYDLNKHLHSKEHNSFKKMYLSELGGAIQAYQKTIEITFQKVLENHAIQNNVEIPSDHKLDIKPIMNIIYYSFERGKIKRYLPSLDITAMLHAKLRWNQTQRYKQGDFDDIGHATSALPYYDCLFTERSLHNMIKECKYDEKYECEVFSKNKDILSFFKNKGLVA